MRWPAAPAHRVTPMMFRTFLALAVANAVSLAATLLMGGDIGWLLWPYWIQSAVIGWFSARRMLALRAFSTAGYRFGGEPVPETDGGRRAVVGFFAVHYGMFHLAYLGFLCAEHWPGHWRDLVVLAACGLGFVFAQRQTLADQVRRDAGTRPNLGTMMFLPYVRIMPIHLLVVGGWLAEDVLPGTGAAGPVAMVLFTVLKTVADVLLDWFDRRWLSRAAPAATAG